MVVVIILFSVVSRCLAIGDPKEHPIHSLYHSQDIWGQYSYGYATPMITRNEIRTADGKTQGGYSYLDSNGVLQTVKYTSDPTKGFQVYATNLPEDLPDVAAAKLKHMSLFKTTLTQLKKLPKPVQDLPEVVAARKAHLAAFEAVKAATSSQPAQETPEVIKARSEHLAIFKATEARDELLRKVINLSPNVPIVDGQTSATLSLKYQPVIETSNDLGLYSYGYVTPLSSHSESKTADGVTRGGYSFIDAFGILRTVTYVADDINGFRVQGDKSNPLRGGISNEKESVKANGDTGRALYIQETVY